MLDLQQFLWIAVMWSIIIVGAWLLAGYLFGVYTGKKGRLDRFLDPIEGLVYRIIGVDQSRQMTGKEYLTSVMIFSAFTAAVSFIVLVLQGYLPFNPQHFPGMQWGTALNAAISFTTNTDLQHYAGQSSLSYLSQMAAIQFQQFTSAAIGICVAVAVFRGFSGKFKGIGNFYHDFVRSVTRVLLPMSVAAALVLVASGVPQTLGGYVTASTIGGGSQVIQVGPIASLVSIMQLGTNGGGYFSSNSSSPFQNPSSFTNWFEIALMLLLVTSMPFLFGKMVGNSREGSMLLIAMYAIYAINLGIAFIGATPTGAGMEARFGAFSSTFWTVTTTSTMTGSTNAALSAFDPLVILAALIGMFVQAAPGGLGVGIVYMLLYAVLTVFIVGLMVGRTPEYLGAKILPNDIKNAVIGFVAHPVLIMVPLALAFSVGAVAATGAGTGPAAFTRVLYEFASAAANNGSDFLGTAANTQFFNASTALVMLFGRFVGMGVMLMIADSMLKRARVSQTGLRTDNLIFVAVLVVSIMILTVLAFFPVLVLGPVLSSLQGLSTI